MIDAYLTGALPTLDAIELDKSPTLLEQVGEQFGVKQKPPPVSFGRNPELLDTLWGQYFAAGEYRPIWRIITLLPWSKERDSAERLTVGSSAKYTLANNAARYPDMLALIKDMAALSGGRRAADPRRGDPRRRDHRDRRHPQGAARAGRQAQDARARAISATLKIWGYVGQGAIGDHLRGAGDDLAHGGGPALRDRRRGDVGGVELLGGAVAQNKTAGHAPGRCDVLPPAYFASGSGRIWNFTTFGRFSLPPSMWNSVRVAVGRPQRPGPSSRRSDRRCGRPSHFGEEAHRIRHAQRDPLAVDQRAAASRCRLPVAIGTFSPRPNVSNWSTQV